MAVDSTAVLLIQFSREPREGQVKTRMMPALSPGQACALHTELTLWTCGQLLDSRLGDVEVSVEGDTAHALFQRCHSMGVSRVSRQCGADLGQRMYSAISGSLKEYAAVILVGSYCPDIDSDYLGQAVSALETTSVVVGPATDGGYVLIGAREIDEAVFENISWGGDKVYAQTCLALVRAGLNWSELPVMRDIDRPADLAHWEAKRSLCSAALAGA
jgi:rSAM/selenodomain-associated transferase 1